MNQPEQARHHQQHEGQILILVAVGSAILLAFAALAVDAGLAMAERRGAQNTADAASMAVARAMVDGAELQELEQTAEYYGELNGYDVILENVEIDELGRTVEIVVQVDVPRIFLGAFYDGTWSVSTTAEAALDDVPQNYALLTLRESGPGINMSGNVEIMIEGGSAMSNSFMTCNGNTELRAEQNVDSNDGFATTGGCEFTGDQGSNPSAPRVDDPLAGTPPPPRPSQPSGLPNGSCSASDGVTTCTPGRYQSGYTFNNGTFRLQPGVYHFEDDLEIRGGATVELVDSPSSGSTPYTHTIYLDNSDIDARNRGNQFVTSGSSNPIFLFDNGTIDLGGNTDLILASGVHYFDGEDLSISGNQDLYGYELMLFFDNGAGFSNAGTTAFEFTPSPTPLYPGMHPNLLFFTAPGSASTFNLVGTSDTYFDGITYMPNGLLDFRGTAAGDWARGQVIVDRADFRGTASGRIEYRDYVEISKPAVYLTR